MFENKTQEVGVEVYFTNALTRQFYRSKVAKILKGEKADVVLRGRIDSITYINSAQASGPKELALLPENTVLTTDYRVRVRSHLILKRQSDKKVLWADDFSGERVYSAPQISLPGANSANANYNESAQAEILKAIAQEMMAEAHERMTENF